MAPSSARSSCCWAAVGMAKQTASDVSYTPAAIAHASNRPRTNVQGRNKPLWMIPKTTCCRLRYIALDYATNESSGFTMPEKKKRETPLEIVRDTSHSVEGSCPVIISFRRRGFLKDYHEEDTTDALNKPPFRPEGKQALLGLAEKLRAHLESKDLPTDKSPIMPKELDWSYTPEEHGVVADEDLWFCVAEGSTEPLTEDRLAAELLHATSRVLARFDEDELRDVFRAMYLYHLHSSVGELNNLAMAGLASEKGLAQGPQTKIERSRTLRQRILEIAQDFWSRHPEFKGHPVNTAKKIADTVNNDRERMRPGSAPLVYKTISNHLSVALKEAEHRQ